MLEITIQTNASNHELVLRNVFSKIRYSISNKFNGYKRGLLWRQRSPLHTISVKERFTSGLHG